jgi:hypothetical protein
VYDSVCFSSQLLVVRHHHECGSVSVEAAKEGKDLQAGCGIELTSGFISQQEGRPVGQSSCNGDPLHLSTGELGGAMPRALLQAHIRQKLQCSFTPLAPADSGLCHGELHIFESSKDGQEVKALKDKAEPRETEPRKLTIRECIEPGSE